MRHNFYFLIIVFAFICVFVITSTGCAATVNSGERVGLAANLTQPCPPLIKLTAGDGKSITKWAVTEVNMHEDCRARHKALVEAITPKEK